MHHGKEEIHDYLSKAATLQTCFMFSSLVNHGFQPEAITDDDFGLTIQCESVGYLTAMASTPDDWDTGALTLSTIEGDMIARFAVLFDAEYIALTLAMMQQIAGEVNVRLAAMTKV
jgi:hypothetical protein